MLGLHKFRRFQCCTHANKEKMKKIKRSTVKNHGVGQLSGPHIPTSPHPDPCIGFHILSHHHTQTQAFCSIYSHITTPRPMHWVPHFITSPHTDPCIGFHIFSHHHTQSHSLCYTYSHISTPRPMHWVPHIPTSQHTDR